MVDNIILTKGQRNRAAAGGRFDIKDIEMRYRDMLGALYQYEGDGIPDNLPRGWIENTALYYSSGCAFKEVQGLGLCLFGASPVYVDIYGQPTQWLPENLWGMNTSEAQKAVGIFAQSDAPVLWNRCSQQSRIRMYLDIIKRTANTLYVNLAALNTPVILNGGVAGMHPGDNIGGLMLESELTDGASFIPMVQGDRLGLEGVDLGITDHTQNLISVMEWADAQVKAVLGLDTGVLKSSGVGPWDADSSGPLATSTDHALELRKAWLEKVNERFGTSITVKRNADITAAVKADDNPNETRVEYDNNDKPDAEGEVD